MRSLPILPVVAAALSTAALSTGLHAQIGVSAKTNVGVFARSSSTAAIKSIKKDTKLSLPASVEAALRQASATTRVSAIRSTSGVGIAVNEIATVRAAGASAGTTTSDDMRNITPGAHSVLASFPAREGAKFVVVASAIGRFQGRANASAGVDIDNDGTVDWTTRVTPAGASKRWLVTAGKTGLAIALQTRALASVGTTVVATGYAASLTLTISPADSTTRCSVARQGLSCGPLLVAAESQASGKDFLSFRTSNARAGGAGIFILGDRVLNVRFPGTRCGLYTNPLIQIARVIDRQGNAVLRFEIPKDFEGKFVAQDIILFRTTSGFGLQSTNGLAVACRKAN